MLSGPSGSGRRHIARAFHGWSPQATGPLLEVSAAGLLEDQQAQALFGDGRSVSPMEEAARGILLVQDADELAPSLRERLTDALRTRQIGATGGGEAGTLKARVVLTAGVDGEKAFPGLALKCVHVLGLAQRKEDILPLAAHFLGEISAEEGIEPVGFTTDAAQALIKENWTGNVRELRERVRQALMLSGHGALSVEALMLAQEGDEILSFKEAKRAFETRYVEGLLRRCSGNISRAARLAKKDRKDFYDVIRRTGVEPSHFRS
jgi:two-component system response regulator GlrR